jgi:predicted type IV restriction endonuclease
MDFRDQIHQLAGRVSKLKEATKTEEATKTAFILPMLQALGYDVFNPMEVVPEYVTDIGTKKGEKIDYAIFQHDLPIILIECKHWKEDLDVHDGQLLRYFHVSKAKFGILTNGIVYRFYTDLEEANKMDEKPFLEFSLLEIKDNQIEELKKFHRSYFDIESIVNTAGELKYMNALKIIIHQELTEPSEAFVRFFAKQAYSGVVTSKVMGQFTGLLKKTVSQYISELITDRLKSALSRETEMSQTPSNETIPTPSSDPVVQGGSKIETTLEEMEAFYMVKGIVRIAVDSSRIHYRDSQSYFSVVLDESNRKTVCRLYMNGRKKQIGVFDSAKNETKHEIGSIDEIFKHSDALIESARFYLASN